MIFWSRKLFMFVKVATTDQVKPGRGFGAKLDKVFIGIYNYKLKLKNANKFVDEEEHQDIL